ncbi:archaemetzincin [Flavobacterium sp.]|uniref:archaemetzincin n=1 Tax=Flavobacterium sp. TaxID=239 RepID=UPI0011FCAC59|nr:archaemetzincin [Flavobacterium sp.]RZJ69184.1 MAG: Zn-dependent protease [Flavobacterium sp.]
MKKLLFLSLVLVSCSDKKSGKEAFSGFDSDYLEAIAPNDKPLDEAKFGDWRQQHHEKKQTFEDYISGSTFVPGGNQNVIYLQPIGKFDAVQNKAIGLTREYLAIFFQRKTVVLAAISDSDIASDSRRQNLGHEQLKTTYILDEILAPEISDDAMAIMAISEKDLYPSDEWNYVFGQASYEKRIGVSSIYRLQDGNFELFARRLINVSSHEIGHMLSLRHCLFAKCAMNGSNNLPETDRSPNRICSDCQKKLTWNLRYDNFKRASELYGFMKGHNLGTADLLGEDFLEASNLRIQKPR